MKILEVNRDNKLIRDLLGIYKSDHQSAILTEMTDILFNACLLLDGYLNDPQALARQTTQLLTQAAGWYGEVIKTK